MNDKFKVSDRFKKSLEEFDKAIAEIEETERKIEAMGTDLVKHHNDLYGYTVLPVGISGQVLTPDGYVTPDEHDEEDLADLPHAGGWMGNCPVVDDFESQIKQYRLKYGVDPENGKHASQYNKIQMSKVGDPNSFPDALECEHEPINVGFATTKMVCKKCDKDL
jgi:hypothetical protein